MNDCTPTQQRMLDLLEDGLPHTRQEIHGCLWDDRASLSAIKYHISNLRKLLRPEGQDIVCELVNRRICYRQVLLLVSPPSSRQTLGVCS